MKKQILPISVIIITLASSPGLKAQVTTIGNAGGIGDYVGWDNTNPFPLQIRHDGNYPINIYTNGSQRMSIRPNGRVGICSANPLSLRM